MIPEAPSTASRKKSDLLPCDIRYVSLEDAEFKLAGLERWQWLWDGLEKCPEGQCVLIDVPDGFHCSQFAATIRAAIGGAKKVRDFKWSVRQTKDEKSIILTKGEMWPAVKRRLETQQIIEQTGKNQAKSTGRITKGYSWDRTGTDGDMDEEEVDDPGIGLTESITKTIEDDGPCERKGLINRILELRPSTSYQSAYGQISQMLKDKRLVQDEKRVLHLAKIYNSHCLRKACIFPVASEGLCAQHLKEQQQSGEFERRAG